MPKIARERLTLHKVNAARATGKLYMLRDSEVAGLVLRVNPTGVKTWAVQWGRGQGRNLDRSLTLDGARIEARKILTEIDLHGAPLAVVERTKPGKVDTFGEFITERYEPWVTAERKAGKATVANLKAQFADFLKKPLSAITAWSVEKFKADRLRAGLKPATVNRDLVRIRACLAKAVEWNVLAEHPLRGVKRTKGDDDSRTRFLSKPEEKRLRDVLGRLQLRQRDHLRPLVLLAINTGLRRGELFGLTWADVELKRAQVTVRAATSKGQRTRHVPLNKEAVAALRAWKPKDAEADAIVFPGPGGGRLTNVNKSWAFLVDTARLDDFRFHDLRHHFASRLVMAGVDLYVVKELLGHSDFAMTQRYAHLAPEHKAAAVELLGAK